MSFLKRCIEKRQQLGISDTSCGLDYTKSEINQYKNQLRNKNIWYKIWSAERLFVGIYIGKYKNKWSFYKIYNKTRYK